MKRIFLTAVLGIGLVLLAGCNIFGGGDNNDVDEPNNIEGTAGDTDAAVLQPLSVIIVRSGIFWDDFWYLDAMFAQQHIEWGAPDHLAAQSYTRLLPSSSFSNLDDVREFLSQFYTAAWIEAELTSDTPPFVEYDGELFILGARAGDSRPNWGTVRNTLISSDGVNAVVETVVAHYVWHQEDAEMYDVTYEFSFVNGRIDSITRR